MRRDFYVFRHGETDYNREKRCQGSGINPDINETGRRQAELLAEKMRKIPLQAVFSSPLQRAVHTAEIVCRSKEIPLFVREDLRECFYGAAEGQLIEDIQKKYADVHENWHNPEVWNIAYPDGESKEDALRRVWRQIEKIAAEEPYQTAGIAVHAGTMGCLLNYLHFDFAKIPNCAVFHLIYEDGKWQTEGGLF